MLFNLAKIYFRFIPHQSVLVCAETEKLIYKTLDKYALINLEGYMGKYDKLLSYIVYCEQANENADRWVFPVNCSPYTEYDNQIDNFMKDIYQSDILDTKYLEHLEPFIKENRNIKYLIPIADIELLLAILIYYISQERFCEGLWRGAIVDKVFSIFFFD